MRILKQGKLNNDPLVFTCKYCGCVFEADNGEYLQPCAWEQDARNVKAKCQCPTCTQMIYILQDN